MRAVLVILTVTLLISMLLFSCSEKCDKNPVGPGDETYMISGKIVNLLLPDHPHFMEMSVFLFGDTYNDTTITSNDGLYFFHNLKKGKYTIVAHNNSYIFEPNNIPITISKDNCNAEEIYCILSSFKKNMCIVTGKILLDSDDSPVGGVYLTASDQLYNYTSNSGYYMLRLSLDNETFTVTPTKEDFEYTFTPNNANITPADSIIIQNFIAHYSGPPLHCISGKAFDFDGNNIPANAMLKHEGQYIKTCYTDLLGTYNFYGLKDGTYQIEFIDNRHIFEESGMEVIVHGEDVEVPEIRAINNYTEYDIYGKIIDPAGKGISNVSVGVYRFKDIMSEIVSQTDTDADGFFRNEIKIDRDKIITYTIIPLKDNFSFDPDSMHVTLQWLSWKKEGEDVTLPEFIGYDYSILTASDYFPLSIGTTWTYTRTENDKEPYDHSVNVTGKVNNGGKMYHRLSEQGPWKFTDFRIEDNSVYAFFDDEDVVFLKFGVVPGTRWESGVIAGTYTRTGTFIGTETVETPAGTFENCAHFVTKVVYGETSYDSYDLWYAPGVGLVKSVKIVENYGRRLEYVVDELKEYEMP